MSSRVWSAGLSAVAVATLVAAASLGPGDRRLQALVLLAMLVALARVGAILAGWLDPDRPPLSRVVAGVACAAAFAGVAATALGHLGVLRPGAFLAVVAVALVLAELARWRWISERPALEEGDARAPELSLRERIDVVAAASALVAMAVGYVADLRRRFAIPLGGAPDDLSYHLSAIAVWKHFGDLRMMKFSMGDWGTVFYPILPELSSWVLLAPFRDSDVAARWAELPFALASFAAVAAIARRLGVGRPAAALAAATYGVIHRVAVLAFAAGNDHVTAFATLAAIDAALACIERPRVGRFGYLGVTLGLLLASKYLGVYNAVTIVALLGLAMAVRGIDRSPAAAAGDGQRNRLAIWAAAASALLVGAAVVGGYTYLRNWATTGNPVYPQPVHVRGIEIWPGREEMSLGGRAGGEQSQIDLPAFLLGRDNLFASFFPLTLLPAALIAPVVAARRRRWRHALVLALPVVFFLEFVYLTWDHRDIRYVLPAVALASVAFVWSTERLGVLGAALRIAMCGLLVTRYPRWMGTRGTRETITSLLVVGVVALAYWQRARWRPALERAWRPLAATGLLGAALWLGANVSGYHAAKLGGSPAALALEQRTKEHGTGVAYAGLNEPYLFFGSHLQNLVHVVPRSLNLEAEHYRWGGPVDPPFEARNFGRWLAAMDELGVRFVVVVRGRDEDPERRWLLARGERFRPVHVDPRAEVWELLPPGRRPRAQPPSGG